MGKLRFTVVTPVLDGEMYLAETIESVIGQSYPHWRYFIMDGGSTDRTLEIANRYAAEDERITVISGSDRGMYDAVFKGFELDNGEICCWINADDKFFPWSFSIVSEAIKSGRQWVTGQSAHWDERGRLFRVGLPRVFPQRLIRTGYFHGRGLGFIQQEGTFFTRALLRKVSCERMEMIRQAKLAGDFALWKALAPHSPLTVLPTVTGGFRIHEANMSRMGMDAYYKEVKQMGGKHLPWIAKLLFRAGSLMFVGWKLGRIDSVA